MIIKLISVIEQFLFRHRLFIIALFAVLSAFLGFKASQIQMGASFEKNIPLNHQYMQTYLKHQSDFGGANSIFISVCSKDSTIFSGDFLTTLKGVHDQLYFIPGVNRTLVSSLYSPSTRFVEVVEDGFAGGPVMPADFSPTPENLQRLRSNIDKSGIVGRLISDDYSCAMVTAQLLDINPDTNEKIDTIAFASVLEDQVRSKFESDSVSIHIIGFAKMVGDIADGAKDVVKFFLIAIAITTVMVWLFSRSLLLTALPILCSLIAVMWQIGILSVLGFSIDPMSILVPFLVFAIGVSHGVQMINAMGAKVGEGLNAKEAAECCVRSLLLPGIVALLSDTVGFLTLLTIDIGVIRELAITASIGVAVVILTNLILLPVLGSYIKFSPSFIEKMTNKKPNTAIWEKMTAVANPKVAIIIVIMTLVGYIAAYQYSQQMKIGDLHAGAPSLHSYSRYNQDVALITDKYAITIDLLKVIVEAKPEACMYHDVMQRVNDFQWQLENVPGVQSAISLSSVSKLVNAGYNEGNVKWRTIPRNSSMLVQSVSRIETSSGLLNTDCSVMPIILFLEDHKAETIERVINKTKALAAELNTDELTFKLASGPVGVMAATNEAVSEAQTPMMIYVYGAVIVLCLLSFKSLRATIAVVLPLYVVSTMAQALMVYLQIGLTVSTLPVIALGVGIGVDYGIYILANMSPLIREGKTLKAAYLQALQERGSAVLFTGITLAIGVSTWVFSALKFQMDMGILLTFMFVVNMLGAVIVLPAISSLLWMNKNVTKK